MITIGQTLNNTYEITEQLGSGGGGIVFKAYHLRLEKYVAIKLIKGSVKDKINQRAEADILKGLKHEGLPQVYDFVKNGEDVYTVMEYIDGHSLFDEIVKCGRIPFARTVELAKELCSAAAYLHKRKPPIIHSDIKPQNIMLTAEGKLCLIDFNISSVFGGGVYTVGSSDGYSPPEQYLARPNKMPVKNASNTSDSNGKTELLIDDDKTELLSDMDATEILDESDEFEISSSIIDSRSDVYSIGAVMYSMVTGMKPNNSKMNIVPLKKINEDIPDSLVFIIEKAMSKDKKDRFASAAEMLKALENITRLDKRYKMLGIRQSVAYIFSVLLLTGSIISIIAGDRLMQAESTDRYIGYISELSDMNVKKDYSRFDEVYSASVNEYEVTPELEFYRAAKLYYENDHDNSQMVLENSVLSEISDLPDNLKTSAYHMEADMLFRKELYDTAVGYYEKSAATGNANADMFRDYAICLARNGDTQKAEEVLETAKSHGITEDSIYMVEGEIQFGRSEYADAVKSLAKAIELSTDSNMKRNAYLLCSRAYKEQYGTGNEELMLANISLLEKSLLDLPQDMTMQLREYLAQAYIDYGEFSGRTEYFAKTVTLLNEMKSLGWSNYQTEMNIAVLCDRIGDSRTCKSLLSEMALVPEYEPYYFTIYVRLAYCEADIQGKTDINERDYSEFDKYYDSAAAAYKIYSENGNSDPEMDKLTRLREEIVRLGWLN